MTGDNPVTPENTPATFMRYAAGVYVADDPGAWTWSVDAIADHVLAAEEKPIGRLAKRAAFALLRRPAFRHLLPLRQVPQVPLQPGKLVRPGDLILRRSQRKWIAFSRRDGILRRYFASSFRWQKEYWIRRQPPVAELTPEVVGWNRDEGWCDERCVNARPVRVHDLREGLAVLRAVWPGMGRVFAIRRVLRPLTLYRKGRLPERDRLMESVGVAAWASQLAGVPVLHGVVHGDFQHSNLLVGEGGVYVIDWGDNFRLGPPLYDLFFYLFRHARSLDPRTVVDAAFADPSWIEEGMGVALDPLIVRASLYSFVGMLADRYHKRGLRRKGRAEKALTEFVATVVERVLVPLEKAETKPSRRREPAQADVLERTG